MNVLVACEFSGVVRDAFTAKGHYAVSCDLLPSEAAGEHYRGSVLDILDGGLRGGWDLMIAHPPCTYLAASGARWWKERQWEQQQALCFVQHLMNADIPEIAIENPVGLLSSRIRKPDQIIQPWQHGHGEIKATCLWLKGLPLLTPSNVVEGREPRIHHMNPGVDRGKKRSVTLTGIADAMAAQWGQEQ